MHCGPSTATCSLGPNGEAGCTRARAAPFAGTLANRCLKLSFWLLISLSERLVATLLPEGVLCLLARKG